MTLELASYHYNIVCIKCLYLLCSGMIARLNFLFSLSLLIYLCVCVCVSVLYVNCIRIYKHSDTMFQEPLKDCKICIHNHDVTLESERMVVCGSLHVVVGLSRSFAGKRMPRHAIVHESVYSRDCCHQT